MKAAALSLLFDDEFGQRARLLRLETLSELRWLAVAGQLAAILVAYFGFGLRFPVAIALDLRRVPRRRSTCGCAGGFPSAYRLADAFATAAARL